MSCKKICKQILSNKAKETTSSIVISTYIHDKKNRLFVYYNVFVGRWGRRRREGEGEARGKTFPLPRRSDGAAGTFFLLLLLLVIVVVVVVCNA